MPDQRDFHFPLSLLLKEGDLILTAGEKYQTQLAARLAPTALADARKLATQVSDQTGQQKSDAGDLGTLTQEQNDQLAALQALLTSAKETAKKAFPGQDVKLREEFQVGVNKPSGLGAVLGRGRIILAALRKAANLDALKGQGWLASDTDAIAAALKGLASADDEQETAKSTKKGTTGGLNRLANQLYAALLAIQNAANLQWPASQPGNTAVRGEFRLEVFPPSSGAGGKKTEPPKPPTPPPA